MPRRTDISPILTLCAALALAAGSAAGAKTRSETEFLEVARNCELPGARLEPVAGERRTLRIFIPPRVRRTDGKIACARLWARERGLRLVEPELPQGVALASIGCGMPRTVRALGGADGREIRIHFPLRHNELGQARRDGSLACLNDWAADRGYQVRIVNEYELD